PPSSARAAWTAASLFSGTTAECRRGAITSGRFAEPGRSVNPRACRNCRKLIGPDYALTQQLSHAEARVVLDYREVGRKPPQTPDLVLPCQHGHLPDSKGPLMEAICAAAVVLAFIAFGELISIWSKARIPSLLVAMLSIFVFAKIGLVPETVIDDSMLVQIYTILVAPLLFHMGTLTPLRVMLKQWRSVIIATSGMLVAVLLILAVVAPLFGFETF